MGGAKKVIAVDLGGTNLRVGLVSSMGKVEAVEKIPSLAKQKTEDCLGQIAGSIQKILETINAKEVKGIALGIPGIVEQKTGVVYRSPHFPDWKSVEVRSFFEKKFKLPIKIDNDAHMIARGEGWKGAAQGLKNFLMFTLGTGIGGAIFIKGDVLYGDSGFAAEVGHIVIEREGRLCGCGSKGCWETYASATGVIQGIELDKRQNSNRALFLEKVGKLGMLTVAKVYDLAKEGDLYAHQVFQRLGYHLGIGIASIVNVTGIETIILGGGVSQSWDFFIEPTQKELRERTYKETAHRIKIKQATLGEEAGLLGGAASFFCL
jgi:glucokinase